MATLCIQAGMKQLLSGLQAMAERESNPVLEVLSQAGPPVQMQHYPDSPLEFNQAGWKAYYHCHAEPFQFPSEHGHFHIFTRIQAQENTWAHVAALSMDEYGQPIRWFATNRWVTDETWTAANILQQRLAQLPVHAELQAVEHWLCGMMGLYSEQLGRLLRDRDVSLSNIENTQGEPSALENRHYYVLAEQKIELLSMLDQVFLNHPSK